MEKSGHSVSNSDITWCGVQEQKQNFAKCFCSWTELFQSEVFMNWGITIFTYYKILFHIIFTCHITFFGFFKPCNNVEKILCLHAMKLRAAGEMYSCSVGCCQHKEAPERNKNIDTFWPSVPTAQTNRCFHRCPQLNALSLNAEDAGHGGAHL